MDSLLRHRGKERSGRPGHCKHTIWLCVHGVFIIILLASVFYLYLTVNRLSAKIDSCTCITHQLKNNEVSQEKQYRDAEKTVSHSESFSRFRNHEHYGHKAVYTENQMMKSDLSIEKNAEGKTLHASGVTNLQVRLRQKRRADSLRKIRNIKKKGQNKEKNNNKKPKKKNRLHKKVAKLEKQVKANMEKIENQKLAVLEQVKELKANMKENGNQIEIFHLEHQGQKIAQGYKNEIVPFTPLNHGNITSSGYISNPHPKSIGKGPPVNLKDWRVSDSLAADFAYYNADNGCVQVKESGLYLIYSQVTYYSSNLTRTFSYSVYRGEDTKIYQCTISLEDIRNDVIKTCYSSAPVMLNKDETICISNPYGSSVRYLYKAENTYWGLIKLSSRSLD